MNTWNNYSIDRYSYHPTLPSDKFDHNGENVNSDYQRITMIRRKEKLLGMILEVHLSYFTICMKSGNKMA
jgi:hypothetical protein